MKNLTRRNLIASGLAGAAAVAVTALPAIAVSVGSDARLLQLCRNYLRLERAHGRTCAAEDRAQEEAWAKEKQRNAKQKSGPPRPEALKGKLDVWPGAAGPFGLVDLEDKDVRETLSKVADGSYTVFACFLPGGDRLSMKSVAPPEASRAKAHEQFAVYDDWAARGGGEPKPKRERRSPAQVKADRALERVCRMQEATAASIAALPAQTMAGIRAKLAVVAADSDTTFGTDHFGSTYAPLVAIMNSAMRDIQRIDLGARLSPPIAA